MNLKLLKDRNFSLLMFSKIVSLVGSGMQNFALSLFVLLTTGSATKFASILAVGVIPQLILGPFAGVLVDWLDRKKLLVILDLLSFIVVSFFAGIYFITGDIHIINIYILTILLSILSTIFQPTVQTIIPSITKKEEIVDANAINSLVMALGNLLAPTLAAIFYSAFGLKFIFIINAISFLISAVSEFFIKVPTIRILDEKLSYDVFKRDFSEGIKFVIKRKNVLSLVILSMILNFALGAFTVGGTFVCKKILMVSNFQYGLIQSVSVAAIMIATMCTGYLSKKYSVGKNLYGSLLLGGIVIAFCGIMIYQPVLGMFSTNLMPYIIITILTYILSTFMGIAITFSGICFQEIVPLSYMGRVGTVVSTISIAAIPLSSVFFGILFDTITSSMIFILTALMVIVPVLLTRNALLSVEDEISIDSKISG